MRPARLLDLGHDRVAGVDALRAVDALHLQAVADVDAGRAGEHARAAVDAVAGAASGGRFALSRAARRAARRSRRSATAGRAAPTAAGRTGRRRGRSARGTSAKSKQISAGRDGHDEERRRVLRRRAPHPVRRAARCPTKYAEEGVREEQRRAARYTRVLGEPPRREAARLRRAAAIRCGRPRTSARSAGRGTPCRPSAGTPSRTTRARSSAVSRKIAISDAHAAAA